jgi:hypothetical protein
LRSFGEVIFSGLSVLVLRDENTDGGIHKVGVVCKRRDAAAAQIPGCIGNTSVAAMTEMTLCSRNLKS